MHWQWGKMVSSQSFFLNANQLREEYGIPVPDASFISAHYRPISREVLMPDGVASETDQSFVLEDAQEITFVQAWNESAYIASPTFPAFANEGVLVKFAVTTQAGRIATVEQTLLYLDYRSTHILPEKKITLPTALNICTAAVLVPELKNLVMTPERINASAYVASCGYQLFFRDGVFSALLVHAPEREVSISIAATHPVPPVAQDGWVMESSHSLGEGYSKLEARATKKEKSNMALFANYLDGKRVLVPEYTTVRNETNVLNVSPVMGGAVTVTKTTTATHYEEEYVFLSAEAAEACVAAVTELWTKTWSDQILSSNTTMDATGLWSSTISVETRERNECVADISTSIDHATGAYTVTVAVNWEQVSCSSDTATVQGRINSLVGTNAQTE